MVWAKLSYVQRGRKICYRPHYHDQIESLPFRKVAAELYPNMMVWIEMLPSTKMQICLYPFTIVQDRFVVLYKVVGRTITYLCSFVWYSLSLLKCW